VERLSFESECAYSGLEASIHIARYLLAKSYCGGRRVLDVACGEGYGSRLLKDWGATEVYGIDVSEEAISHAQKNFGGDGVQFHCSAAENLLKLLDDQRFDLIVSLETIEHLHSPGIFLADLRQLLNPGGHIIISCPNDEWYYPEADESNPFHIRKYSYEEFLALVTPILGEPDAVGLGLPIAGFINLPMQSVVAGGKAQVSQLAMMGSSEYENVWCIPVEPDSVSTRNSSYFIALWGGVEGEGIKGAAMLPVPMDIFRNGMYSAGADWNAKALEIKVLKERLSEHVDKVADLKLEAQTAQATLATASKELEERLAGKVAEVADLKQKAQSAQVNLATVSVENDVLSQNVGKLLSETVRLENELAQAASGTVRLENELAQAASEKVRLQDELALASIAAHRYFVMRSYIPSFLLRFGRFLRKRR
jgi:SAM-dependent methyltransferase